MIQLDDANKNKIMLRKEIIQTCYNEPMEKFIKKLRELVNELNQIDDVDFEND